MKANDITLPSSSLSSSLSLGGLLLRGLNPAHGRVHKGLTVCLVSRSATTGVLLRHSQTIPSTFRDSGMRGDGEGTLTLLLACECTCGLQPTPPTAPRATAICVVDSPSRPSPWNQSSRPLTNRYSPTRQRPSIPASGITRHTAFLRQECTKCIVAAFFFSEK